MKYPIGEFRPPVLVSATQRAQWSDDISALPANLSSALTRLDDSQLDTPYREGGWTVRQVVHHLADSHMNSVIRFRWALTEDAPLIKPYDEQLWAELPDAKSLPVSCSLQILEGLHRRWTMLLQSMTEADFQRKLVHPVSGELTLDTMLALYSWHGRHHVAHITELKKRQGWQS